GFKGRVRRVAISSRAQPEGIEQIDTSKYPDTARYLTAPYEGVISEYDGHTIRGRKELAQLAKRPQYQEFRQALMQRMERDQELDSFLAHSTTAAFRRASPAPEPWKPALRLRFAEGRQAPEGP